MEDHLPISVILNFGHDYNEFLIELASPPWQRWFGCLPAD